MQLFFKGFGYGFSDFGSLVSSIVNNILLFIVFIIGVGLVAICSKLLKKEFLNIKPKVNESYWLDRLSRNKNLEDSSKPF